MRKNSECKDTSGSWGGRFLDNRIFHLAIIVLIAFLAYSNTFNVPFVFDDASSIADNPVIRDLGNFFSNSTGYDYNPRRFIGYLSFALNYRLGGVAVSGYHLVNLAIHIANALLVYLLAGLTIRTPYFKGRLPVTGTLSLIPLVSALLFVAHPIQTQAVTYIVQRLTSLTTLFYLAALVLFIYMRMGLESGRMSRVATAVLLTLSLSSTILAMKTKEIAFTLPIVMALYEISFFRSSLIRKAALLAPYLATLLIIPFSMLTSGKAPGELLSDLSEATVVQTDISRWDYLLTQFRVIVTYIRLIFFPVNQNLDYDYPIHHSFFEPAVFISFFSLVALIASAAYLFYRSSLSAMPMSGDEPPQDTERSDSVAEYRLLAFAIFWFFITLSVESSVIPIVDVIFEHRLYLPSVGAFIAISVLLYLMYKKFHGIIGGKIVLALGVCLVVLLVSATWRRNLVWSDELTLWRDCFDKAPGKARVNYNLGTQLASRGLVDEGIAHLVRAIQIRPNSQEYNNLGSAYQRKGLIDQAIEMYHRAISMESDNAEAYYNLGTAYIQLGGKDGEAADLFLKALYYRPGYDDASINLAAAYNRLGRFNDAAGILLPRISGNLQWNAAAHFNLGVALQSMGNYDGAMKELNTLKGIDRQYAATLEGYINNRRESP